MKRIVIIAAVLATAAVIAWSIHHRAAATPIPCFTVGKLTFARRVTADGNLRAVVATPVNVPDVEGFWGVMTIASLAADGSAVKAGDVILRFDPVPAENQLHEAEQALAIADARLAKEKVRAATSDADHAARAALAAHQAAEAREFQAVDPVLFSRNQIIESELDTGLASAQEAQAERARVIDRKVARAGVELAAIDRQRAVLAVGHAKTALAHLEIHAPNDGLLVLRRDDKGDLPKLGARLYSDQTIAELPVLDAMEAELFVLEVDGGGLEVGQPAEVVVASRPDVVYRGTIRLVDKLAKPRDMGGPVQYFSVVVALATTDRAVMKPGQRVRASLVLDQADTLVVPRQAVFERDGKMVVYRRDDHGFTPVVVRLGAATPGRIAIISGLVAGDVIAERDPTADHPGATP